MSELEISWTDVLPVGKGGPGCGLLHINGREPKGNFRYLPPAIAHEGKVYASTFVPRGFIVCAIDPETLARTELSPRLDYCRIKEVDGGCLIYYDRHDSDSESRIPLAAPRSWLQRFTRGAGKGNQAV